MSAIKVNNHNFENEVMNSDKKVLIDFFASWCGPCRMVSPIIDEIADERDDVAVLKINVDDEPELAGAYGVYSIPTLVFLKNGEVISKSSGYKPKAQILSMLEG